MTYYIILHDIINYHLLIINDESLKYIYIYIERERFIGEGGHARQVAPDGRSDPKGGLIS